MSAARGDALGAVHGALDRLALSVRRGGEAECRGGRHGALLPLRDLLWPYAREHHGHLHATCLTTLAGASSQDAQQMPQGLSLSGTRRPHDHSARATTERSQPLDCVKRWIPSVQRETLTWVGHGQVLVMSPLGHRVGRCAVDRVDRDQRWIAL